MANDRMFHHPTRNRESGVRVQQPLAVPPPNALRMHQAPPGQKDVTQVNQRNVGDPSGMAQERKTKQGVDGMSPPNSHVLVSTVYLQQRS